MHDDSRTGVGEGRPYAGQRPADRAARRRRRLLDAGLEVIGTVGYHRATVRSICREARVADRSFYEEFASTEELLLAVYAECLERLRGAVVAAVDGLEADLALVAHDGVDAFLACIEGDRRLARIVWFEVIGVSAQAEAAYLEAIGGFSELLVTLLEGRQLLGDTGADDRAIVALAMVGGISQVVLNWVNHDFRPPRPRLVRPLVGFLLGGTEPRP